MLEKTAHVAMMYHPSHHVLDLDDAERWFDRVFGAPSTNISTMLGQAPPAPGRSIDYSTFTPIRDVLFDTIDPERYTVDHIQQYPSITAPHLKGLGWYAADAAEVYRQLRQHGFQIVDQSGNVAEGENPPTAGPMPLFFTVAEDAGLRYEFVPQFPFPLDHRLAPDWSLSETSSADPLGIVRCSHHTILTDQPERQRRLLVDVLGGTVFDEGRNELIGTTSTYVHLADAVFEIAVPDQGTAAHADWAERAPADTYHSLTFIVADLDQVAKHLASSGVTLLSQSDTALVTDPTTSLGIPWGFVTTALPGDPRSTPTQP